MYTLTRTEDYNTYVIKHFMCNTQNDLTQIVADFKDESPRRGLHAGWTALVATTSETTKYILLLDKVNWTKVTSSGGSPAPDPSKEYIWDGGGVIEDDSEIDTTKEYVWDGGGVS